MLAVHTIGAGGGSIASLDDGGALQVGPASAGASPGPACYGQGGTAATVTDAHVVLGRLPTDQALGGHLSLQGDPARAALGPLAEALGCSLEHAAEGILAVANEHMTQALRVMSLERGIDPRQCVLASFGGAGGLHLCDLADALGMEEALIPAYGGVLSAFGMLASPPARVLSQDLRCALDEDGLRRAQAAHRRLSEEGFAALGAEAEEAALESALALQYTGQGYALEVPFDPTLTTLAGLREAFEAVHEARYGYRLGKAVSVVRLRLTVRTAPALGSDLPDAHREEVAFNLTPWPVVGHGSVPRVMRSGLRVGDEVRGPAIIQETTATHWLAPGWRAECQRGGHLRLRKILT
jgi:N-methylhydantoinase A